MTKLFVFLSIVLLLSGCSQNNDKEKYIAGKYTAASKGNNGDITIEVSVDTEKILDIQILDHNETPGISDAPFKIIPAAIIETNSTEEIDLVSGATNTSKAIVSAVESALTEASKTEK